MKLSFREPINPRYIHVDPTTRNVHLLMPVVGGVDIATDNTCKAGLALQEFFGMKQGDKQKSALSELQKYKIALEFDLALIGNIKSMREIKKEKKIRLAQINHYIAAVSAIMQDPDVMSGLRRIHPTYPEAIQAMLANRTNVHTISLSPLQPDIITNAVNPVFRVSSNGFFDKALKSGFKDLKKAEQSAKGLLIKAALAAFGDASKIKNNDDFNRLLAIIAAEARKLFGDKFQINFDKPKNPLDPSVTGKIDYTYMADIIIADDDTTAIEFIENIVETCAPNLSVSIENMSPFYEKNSANIDHILPQFLLGQVNVYCYTNDLSTVNFGEILDGDRVLSKQFVDAVVNALKGGDSVESVVYKFINDHKEVFGLKHELTEKQTQEITLKFFAQFNTVKGAPHYDEFTILDQNKPGSFMTHQGAICVDFAESLNKFSAVPEEHKQSLAIVAADYHSSQPRKIESDKNSNKAYAFLWQVVDFQDKKFIKSLTHLLKDKQNVPMIGRILLNDDRGDIRLFQQLDNKAVAMIAKSPNFKYLCGYMARQNPSVLSEFDQHFKISKSPKSHPARFLSVEERDTLMSLLKHKPTDNHKLYAMLTSDAGGGRMLLEHLGSADIAKIKKFKGYHSFVKYFNSKYSNAHAIDIFNDIFEEKAHLKTITLNADMIDSIKAGYGNPHSTLSDDIDNLIRDKNRNLYFTNFHITNTPDNGVTITSDPASIGAIQSVVSQYKNQFLLSNSMVKNLIGYVKRQYLDEQSNNQMDLLSDVEKFKYALKILKIKGFDGTDLKIKNTDRGFVVDCDGSNKQVIRADIHAYLDIIAKERADAVQLATFTPKTETELHLISFVTRLDNALVINPGQWSSVRRLLENAGVAHSLPADFNWEFGRSQSTSKLCLDNGEYRIEFSTTNGSPAMTIYDVKNDYVPVQDHHIRHSILNSIVSVLPSLQAAVQDQAVAAPVASPVAAPDEMPVEVPVAASVAASAHASTPASTVEQSSSQPQAFSGPERRLASLVATLLSDFTPEPGEHYAISSLCDVLGVNFSPYQGSNWEIGRSAYSGNVSLTTSSLRIEFIGAPMITDIVIRDRSHGYAVIDDQSMRLSIMESIMSRFPSFRATAAIELVQSSAPVTAPMPSTPDALLVNPSSQESVQLASSPSFTAQSDTAAQNKSKILPKPPELTDILISEKQFDDLFQAAKQQRHVGAHQVKSDEMLKFIFVFILREVEKGTVKVPNISHDSDGYHLTLPADKAVLLRAGIYDYLAKAAVAASVQSLAASSELSNEDMTNKSTMKKF